MRTYKSLKNKYSLRKAGQTERNSISEIQDLQLDSKSSVNISRKNQSSEPLKEFEIIDNSQNLNQNLNYKDKEKDIKLFKFHQPDHKQRTHSL